MEEKDEMKKFSEYDFSNSPKWQAYLKGLYPTPPLNKIDKFKRKFYKREIDNNFGV